MWWVTSKSFAFYFQKSFVIDICRGKIPLEKFAKPIKRDWEKPNYANRKLDLLTPITRNPGRDCHNA